MRKRKFMRFISILTLVFLMLPYFNVAMAEEDPFKDVENYYPFNSWAVNTGKKYSYIFLEDNTRPCTRYEIANLLYNIINLSKANKNIDFKDLDSVSNAARERISCIASENIILGYDDGTFRPNNNVSRAEFVTMLDRTGIVNYDKINNNIAFDDVIGYWAEKSITKIAKAGIVNGKSSNKFCPEDTITPQEIFIIMDRLVTNSAIDSKTLVTAMTDTFKSKVYSEEERFLIETVYSEFDEVQNFFKYNWPLDDLYNADDWQGLVTYEELINVEFYAMSACPDTQDEDFCKKMYNKGINELISNNLLKNTSEEEMQRTLTIRDMLYVTDVLDRNFTTYTSFEAIKKVNVESLKYLNKNEILGKDKEILEKFLCPQNYRFFDNNELIFPLDAKLTRFAMNYILKRLLKSYSTYKHDMPYSISEFIGEAYQFETSPSNIPSNYYEYPYIVSGIPKEVYERPFLQEEVTKIKTPIESYKRFLPYEGSLISFTNTYLNTILNVDYRTLNKDAFTKKVDLDLYYVSDEEIEKYLQYVIDNQIVLKGKATAVPGTMYLSGPYAYIRVVLDFEIVSAKENKNLLFGDFYNIPQDVIYASNKYNICLDMWASSVTTRLNNEPIFIQYKPQYEPIITYAYPESDTYIMP